MNPVVEFGVKIVFVKTDFSVKLKSVLLISLSKQ